ncbi:hypothetical protein RZ721_004832 [Escherichia coli]|nr:hypothetical protein [Escherichia coli]ELN4640308.1 hypothetical protein [Escherichia coli]
MALMSVLAGVGMIAWCAVTLASLNIFESPSSVESVGGWKEWQSYFSSTGNRLMADFVGKAIRFTNPR